VTDRDPRILAGGSALAREQFFTTTVWVATGLIPLGILAAGLSAALVQWPQHDLTAALTILILGPLALIAACGYAIGETGMAAARRQRAEVAAGYTTLLKRYDHVDGIDEHTGTVVRPAIPRLIAAAIGDTIGTGIELGAVDALHTPFGVLVRNRRVVIATAISLVVLATGVVAIAVDPDASAGWSGLAATLGGLGFILFPVFGLAYSGTRYYLTTLQADYPAAKVLPGSSQDGDIVAELLPSDAAHLIGARDRQGGFLVLESDRVIFFSRSRDRLVPFLEIPRTRIHSAHVGSVYVGRGVSTSAAVLSVTKDDGASIDITLGFSASHFASPMKMAIELDDSASWVRHWAAARS
jgi:hypothetical protein